MAHPQTLHNLPLKPARYLPNISAPRATALRAKSLEFRFVASGD